MILILCYKLFLFIAFLVALYLMKISESGVPYFLIYLGLTNILDVFGGSILTYFGIHNTWIYNILILIQVPYFIYLFSNYFTCQNKDLYLRHLFWIVLIISCGNFFFVQGVHEVNNFSYLIGMSVLCVLIIKYYYSLLTSDLTVSLLSLPLFWLSIGILIFFTASFPILAYLNIIIISISFLKKQLYELVGIGNIFLSLSYIMVVVCPLMIRK